jgi:large subunit ribosomal protein L21
MSAYAVIRTGGKQLRVVEDDVIIVERLAGDQGDKVTFGEVLMRGGDKVEIGTPLIEGAAVAGEIVEQRKGEKIIIFKKKRRQNYRRKKGHRQLETVVRITSLTGKASAKKAAAKPAAEPQALKAEEPRKEAAPKKTPAKSAKDDLKLIGGVGKVLEGKLNDLGITTFQQVADFTPEEIARVDEALSFKGRIEREDWIGQAKELMSGAEPRAAVDKKAAAAKKVPAKKTTKKSD